VIYAGTSGYSFKKWVGSFYPEKTPSRKYLAYYASRLNSVEVNHTFRRFPRSEVSAGWAEAVPESFRFSIKMHQSVTHRARLKDVGDSVSDFLRALDPLENRLGVVLFQLPPYLPASLDRLKSFLKGLPAGYRFAMEFRHPSWKEPAVHELLSEAAVALCAAELEIGESDFVKTAPFAYMRLRKVPPYTDEEVQTARRQVLTLREQVEEVYLYLKHDDGGIAPEVALRLKS
jgi:uncharacterized protein YecE (DUF72 family)